MIRVRNEILRDYFGEKSNSIFPLSCDRVAISILKTRCHGLHGPNFMDLKTFKDQKYIMTRTTMDFIVEEIEAVIWIGHHVYAHDGHFQKHPHSIRCWSMINYFQILVKRERHVFGMVRWLCLCLSITLDHFW